MSDILESPRQGSRRSLQELRSVGTESSSPHAELRLAMFKHHPFLWAAPGGARVRDGFVFYDGVGAISSTETAQACDASRSLIDLLSNEPETVAAHA